MKANGRVSNHFAERIRVVERYVRDNMDQALDRGELAAVAGFTDFAANSRIRDLRDAWQHLFANLALVLVEGVNLILRLPDAAVAGSFGIVLSAVAVLVLLFSGWKGGELVFRYGVGQIGPR